MSTPADAQTIEELRAQIRQLKEQVEELSHHSNVSPPDEPNMKVPSDRWWVARVEELIKLAVKEVREEDICSVTPYCPNSASSPQMYMF